MARRKSKAKQREELINALFTSIAFLSFFGTYYITRSLSASAIITIITFAIVFSIMGFNHMQRIERLKRSGINEIDKMDGFQFERYFGTPIQSTGYKVKVTTATGDYGADLVISKDGKKIVVQAKRYAKNVWIKAVQEAQASIAHYSASEAWVGNRRY